MVPKGRARLHSTARLRIRPPSGLAAGHFRPTHAALAALYPRLPVALPPQIADRRPVDGCSSRPLSRGQDSKARQAIQQQHILALIVMILSSDYDAFTHRVQRERG